MVGKASYLSRFLSPLVRLLGSKWSAQMKLKDAHNSCGIFKWVFTSGFSKKADFLDEQKLQVFMTVSEKSKGGADG